MDIRQLIADRPKLGRQVDLRFAILHNLRTIQQHEPVVAEYLRTHAPLTLTTREHNYELSVKEGTVEVIIRGGSAIGGVPYLEVPHPVQLFCNEVSLLHKNQLQFIGLTDSELRQVSAEFQSVTPDNCLRVEKGRFVLKIHRQDDRLCFDSDLWD